MTAHTGKDAEKGDHLFFAGRCTVTVEICAVVLQKMGDPKGQVFSTHNTWIPRDYSNAHKHKWVYGSRVPALRGEVDLGFHH